MTYSVSSPVTGAAQTGLTTPTYTVVSDKAPTSLGTQHAVTALGGTQTGVDVSSAAKPFTVNFVRPAVLKTSGVPNPVDGILRQNGSNQWSLITRKGVVPLSGQSPRPMLIRTIIEVPAGAEAVEPEDIRAALSLHIGILNQQSAGIGDTIISGVV